MNNNTQYIKKIIQIKIILNCQQFTVLESKWKRRWYIDSVAKNKRSRNINYAETMCLFNVGFSINLARKN